MAENISSLNFENIINLLYSIFPHPVALVSFLHLMNKKHLVNDLLSFEKMAIINLPHSTSNSDNRF